MSRNDFRGNRLTIYLFGDSAGKIATRTHDDQSWYMAADICRLVGISSHSQAVHRQRKNDDFTLEEYEWRKEPEYIGGYGKKLILMVNNGGMLKLIYQSKTPAARAVQERITTIPEELFPEQWHDYLDVQNVETCSNISPI